MEKNAIYCGDCKDVLKKEIKSESVDLIYLDPPFFTNKNYEVVWGDNDEIRSFKDRWAGGINHFTGWLEERLEACKDVLKKTGSIYVHCDWRASHYIRMSIDRVFDPHNFQDEIIWHFTGGGRSKRYFSRKHNTIFFYSKTNEFTFNIDEIRVPYKETSGYAKGGITSKSGKRYTPNPKGTPIDDVWDIPIINPLSRERLGYPTQKPEALLERIVKASSNPGDLVLDPFCGCGTTIAVAHKNNREWIGIDISPIACKVIKKRMENLEDIANVDIIGLPVSIDDVKSYDPFAFQEYVCKKLGGKSSERKSGDMGIDGYYASGVPIQVKQSEGVGRNVVDNFETAIRRKQKKEGTIVAFSFAKSAKEEAARAVQYDGLKVSLVTVEELLRV
jgi:DNA modification methylase